MVKTRRKQHKVKSAMAQTAPAPLQLFPDKEQQKLKPKGQQKHIYWCPYCAAYQKFKMNGHGGIRMCSECGISDREFHVRNANKLWR